MFQDITDLFGADLPVEGGKGGEFAWCDGPLLAALKAGHWIVLDEVSIRTKMEPQMGKKQSESAEQGILVEGLMTRTDKTSKESFNVIASQKCLMVECMCRSIIHVVFLDSLSFFHQDLHIEFSPEKSHVSLYSHLWQTCCFHIYFRSTLQTLSTTSGFNNAPG